MFPLKYPLEFSAVLPCLMRYKIGVNSITVLYPTRRNSTVVPTVVVPDAVRVRAEIPFSASPSEKIMIDPGDKVRTVADAPLAGVQTTVTFCPLVADKLRRYKN